MRITPFQHQEKIKAQILDSYKTPSIIKSKVGDARFSKSEQEAFKDMLEKGSITDSLANGYGYGNTPVVFEKTGKEIKEKLPVILASLEAEKTVIETKLNELAVQAGIVPDQPNSRRYDNNVPFLRYSYSLSEGK